MERYSYSWSNPNLCANRAERMRGRAFHIEARAGRYRNAERLVELSLEAHTIAELR